MGERRGHYHANYCSVDPEPSVYECEESHDLRSLVIDIAAFMYAAGMVDEARWSNSLQDLSDHIIQSRIPICYPVRTVGDKSFDTGFEIVTHSGVKSVKRFNLRACVQKLMDSGC